VALAVLFFLVRMSKSVVRRAYHGDTVRSRRARAPELMERLAEQGRRIIVFELEGPIFFGTAEGLAGRVDAAAKAGARQVILDLKRVNELDSTGARILLQINESLRAQGGNLLLSYPHDDALVSSVLRDLGVAERWAKVACSRTPTPLSSRRRTGCSWPKGRGGARRRGGRGAAERARGIERNGMCGGARPPRSPRLSRGETVIREGSEDRDLFLISRGTASVRVNGPA
jgi:anti-anti-sigma factor